MATFSDDAHLNNDHLNGNRTFRNRHTHTSSLDRLLTDELTIHQIALRLCGEPNQRLSSKRWGVSMDTVRRRVAAGEAGPSAPVHRPNIELAGIA